MVRTSTRMWTRKDDIFLKKPLWELNSSVVSNSMTPGTAVLQGPLSMGILQARILEWLPCPRPGGRPNPGIGPKSPALQVDS